MKVSVLFQSRTASYSAVDYCEQDMILMSPADIRTLKCKIGSFVTVFSPDSNMSLLCRVWPSKKLTGNGNATLNRIWWSNFPGEQNSRSAIISRDTSQFFVASCMKAILSIQTASSSAAAAEIVTDVLMKSTLFLSYILGCLQNVPLAQGMTMGLTWKGTAFILTVVECLPNEAIPQDKVVRCMIDLKTRITFIADADLSEKQETNSQSDHTPKITIENTIENGCIPGFSSYPTQVKEAMSVLCLGLSLGDRGRHLLSLAGVAPSASPLTQQLFKPPRGLLIHGPPGTGKSVLMKALVLQAGCASVEVSEMLLLHKYAGEAEQELQRMFQYASRHAPCCVLIDNADILCKKRTHAETTDLQRRMVSCLLALLDGVNETLSSGVFVIATTSAPELLDAAFRRPGRLDKEIEIGVPNAVQREEILAFLVNQAQSSQRSNIEGCAITPGNMNGITMNGVQTAAKRAHGMVGADLLQVLKEAQLLNLQRFPVSLPREIFCDLEPEITTTFESLSITDTNCLVTDTDLLDALTKVPPSALREIAVELPTVHWTDIGGMDSVKQSLREVVEWPLMYPELFVSFAVLPPRGVLLYGPPGCSKTLMAKALATEAGMNFLTVRGPELLSKWLGESEKAVQTLFRRARAAAPSVIFFDEIDALAGKRGRQSAGVSDRVLAQLLAELDGIGSDKNNQRVIVVAATNRPDLLDPALVRPGRIDRKVYVPPPDRPSRLQILKIEVAKLPVPEVDYEVLADLTEGFSGAEVVAVCSEAAMLAMDEDLDYVPQAMLEKAARDTKPQITAATLDFYHKYSF